MLIVLLLSISFLFYSRRKMMRGYKISEDHRQYDDLAPETCVKR